MLGLGRDGAETVAVSPTRNKLNIWGAVKRADDLSL